MTRPQHQVGSWQKALEACGAITLSIPLMEIVPIAAGEPEFEPLKQRILNLDHYRYAIFVSQNAAEMGAQWIDQYWPQQPLGLTCFAVGEATAKRLNALGIDAVHPGGAMNSEALLELLELRPLRDQKVLIFRGVGGRPRLADRLSELGATVDYAELYRRCLPADSVAALMQQGAPSADTVVSFHSGETLVNFVDALESIGDASILPLWQRCPIVVPGERVAAEAGRRGFETVIVATNAADVSMLNALQTWQTTRENP